METYNAVRVADRHAKRRNVIHDNGIGGDYTMLANLYPRTDHAVGPEEGAFSDANGLRRR